MLIHPAILNTYTKCGKDLVDRWHSRGQNYVLAFLQCLGVRDNEISVSVIFFPLCTEEPAQAVPTQTYDVVITATPTDAELVSFIKGKQWVGR